MPQSPVSRYNKFLRGERVDFLADNREGRGDLIVKKYVCTVCGYVYDPETGDPDSGIAPGTAFEDIPDDQLPDRKSVV